MATALATLRLDRNAATFQLPAGSYDVKQLGGILSSTFKRLDQAWRTLKVIVDGPDSNPNTPVDVTVVTGASIVGGQLQLTTAVIRVFNQSSGSPITLGSSVNVHSGNPTVSGTTLHIPTKDVFVLSSASGSDATLAGTDCT